ncbi:SDR family NAD(P)-dependent oxidoreductase [Pseudokineococcus lusitanus]|uniref:NAD(P)-dependent dehydrogenase (Short-subunit alcohol dehydrogenase family) n=1 Tax=Pseudokineococcus lusitanus TaxID=763993 RepID=A0A3N1HQP8_9ACTN|nr:SDR family NAD(P)-dependent oxidoreductase [Pseudokineococcus lusitanus]ROP44712.1 NAD(P)-dependent dehydrogenase (short-subunit alcohol dehydrogenase family) [Pseudokineococcus lusitanus]
MNVEGTVALVTGGASGLGLATTRALVDAGARVVVVDLPGQAAAVADLGPSVTFAAADVTDEEQVAAAVAVATDLGPLRAVVLCAGVAPAARVVGRDGPHPLDLFERTVRVNLLGTFAVLRLAATAMAATAPVDGERGVVVMTSSVAAFDGQVGQAAYAASKGAVAAMTLPVARELAAHAVRVVSVAPGVFETPLVAGLRDDVRASLGSQVPHPSRLGRPEEFAALVLHVVANPYLNGEVVRLDGALRMGAS